MALSRILAVGPFGSHLSVAVIHLRAGLTCIPCSAAGSEAEEESWARTGSSPAFGRAVGDGRCSGWCHVKLCSQLERSPWWGSAGCGELLLEAIALVPPALPKDPAFFCGGNGRKTWKSCCWGVGLCCGSWHCRALFVLIGAEAIKRLPLLSLEVFLHKEA